MITTMNYQELITAIAEDIRSTAEEHGTNATDSFLTTYLDNLAVDICAKLDELESAKE